LSSSPASGANAVLVLELPPAPPLNNAYRNVPGQGRVKTSRYTKWVKQADAHYVLQALHRAPKITVPYVCRMVFPLNMRSDIDSRAKLTLDWMVARGLTIDDRYCRRLILDMEPLASELVRIEVTPHGDAAHGEPRARPPERTGR
jgi:hypothetical protein